MSERLTQTELLQVPREICVGFLGTIGSGKTTVAEYMTEHWRCKPIEESFRQNPYLEPFYDNQKRYSYQSQIFFLEDAVAQLKAQEKRSGPIVRDPDILMHYRYAYVHRLMGWMKKSQWESYQDRFKTMVHDNDIKEADFYLITKAEQNIRFDRIRKRNRTFELKLLNERPEYFNLLADQVDLFVENFKDKKRILVINTGYDILEKGSPKNELVLGRIDSYIARFLTEGKFGTDGREILTPYRSNGYSSMRKCDDSVHLRYTDGKSI